MSRDTLGIVHSPPRGAFQIRPVTSRTYFSRSRNACRCGKSGSPFERRTIVQRARADTECADCSPLRPCSRSPVGRRLNGVGVCCASVDIQRNHVLPRKHRRACSAYSSNAQRGRVHTAFRRSLTVRLFAHPELTFPRIHEPRLAVRPLLFSVTDIGSKPMISRL